MVTMVISVSSNWCNGRDFIRVSMAQIFPVTSRHFCFTDCVMLAAFTVNFNKIRILILSGFQNGLCGIHRSKDLNAASQQLS